MIDYQILINRWWFCRLIFTDSNFCEEQGIHTQRVICTIKLARYLDKNGVIPKYNLQYLRYYLGLEIEATAHDALSDILVLEGLFNRLNAKFQENDKLMDPVQEMINISSKPVLIARMPCSASIRGCSSVRCHRTIWNGYLERSWTRIWRSRWRRTLGMLPVDWGCQKMRVAWQYCIARFT